jgi:hypothetical protein
MLKELLENNYTFIDDDLVEVRNSLLTNLTLLRANIILYYESIDDGKMYIIKRDNFPSEKWIEITENINNVRAGAWENFKLFMKLGRKKFGIEYNKIGQA